MLLQWSKWLNPKYTILQYYFSSDEVVERQEYLVYDDNALIGYIGGTLGLFLGLSCFGLLKSSFNKILEYLIKDKEKNTGSVPTLKMSERQQNYLSNHQELQKNGVLKQMSERQKNYLYNHQEFQRNSVCRRSF